MGKCKFFSFKKRNDVLIPDYITNPKTGDVYVRVDRKGEKYEKLDDDSAWLFNQLN